VLRRGPQGAEGGADAAWLVGFAWNPTSLGCTLQTDLLTDCGTVHCGGERGDLLLQPPELQLHAIDTPAK